jgi:hypothetical protein
MASALVRPIYRAEYLVAWNSIESTFISDGHFLRDHWPHPAWQPNWYGGTRFDYVYPPALRYGTAAISKFKGRSTARAYHIYIAVLYAIGIAGVYWLVRTGSGSRWLAFWAAVASALVSPCFLLFHNFLIDYGTIYWMPLRLGVLIRYGEGPHMSSFAVLPFALAGAWYGLRRSNPGRLAGAAIASALVVAHNFYGATALAIFFPILVWCVWLAEQDGWVWARAAAIAALAWGLCACWFTPSYVRITLANMALVSSTGHAWSAVLAAVVIAIYGMLSWKLARGRPDRAWANFCIGGLVVMGLNVMGNQYFDFRVMGEPGRLMPELDLAILLAGTALLAWIAGRGAWWRVTLAAVLAVACLVPGKGYVRHAWRILPPPSTDKGRIELVLTDWIAQNLPGVRTLVTGSLRFWYNTWHELPELGGGSEQGLLNINSNHAYFHAVADDNVEFCVAWMQAMGTGAVAVHDKNSAEVYHDFGNPGKFEGKLEKVYDNQAGDRIYRIPRRWPWLARVADGAALRAVPVSPPEPDLDQLYHYRDLLEHGPDSPAPLTWRGPEEMTVNANLAPGQLLLIQESYDPAWHATSAGRDVPITRDPYGQLLLDPGPGAHRIDLRFETPLENRIGIALTLASLAACAVLIAKGRR